MKVKVGPRPNKLYKMGWLVKGFSARGVVISFLATALFEFSLRKLPAISLSPRNPLHELVEQWHDEPLIIFYSKTRISVQTHFVPVRCRSICDSELRNGVDTIFVALYVSLNFSSVSRRMTKKENNLVLLSSDEEYCGGRSSVRNAVIERRDRNHHFIGRAIGK